MKKSEKTKYVSKASFNALKALIDKPVEIDGKLRPVTKKVALSLIQEKNPDLTKSECNRVYIQIVDSLFRSQLLKDAQDKSLKLSRCSVSKTGNKQYGLVRNHKHMPISA